MIMDIMLVFVTPIKDSVKDVLYSMRTFHNLVANNHLWLVNYSPIISSTKDGPFINGFGLFEGLSNKLKIKIIKII